MRPVIMTKPTDGSSLGFRLGIVQNFQWKRRVRAFIASAVNSSRISG
jgi:hypothetical protein